MVDMVVINRENYSNVINNDASPSISGHLTQDIQEVNNVDRGFICQGSVTDSSKKIKSALNSYEAEKNKAVEGKYSDGKGFGLKNNADKRHVNNAFLAIDFIVNKVNIDINDDVNKLANGVKKGKEPEGFTLKSDSHFSRKLDEISGKLEDKMSLEEFIAGYSAEVKGYISSILDDNGIKNVDVDSIIIHTALLAQEKLAKLEAEGQGNFLQKAGKIAAIINQTVRLLLNYDVSNKAAEPATPETVPHPSPAGPYPNATVPGGVNVTQNANPVINNIIDFGAHEKVLNKIASALEGLTSGIDRIPDSLRSVRNLNDTDIQSRDFQEPLKIPRPTYIRDSAPDYDFATRGGPGIKVMDMPVWSSQYPQEGTELEPAPDYDIISEVEPSIFVNKKNDDLDVSKYQELPGYSDKDKVDSYRTSDMYTRRNHFVPGNVVINQYGSSYQGVPSADGAGKITNTTVPPANKNIQNGNGLNESIINESQSSNVGKRVVSQGLPNQAAYSSLLVSQAAQYSQSLTQSVTLSSLDSTDTDDVDSSEPQSTKYRPYRNSDERVRIHSSGKNNGALYNGWPYQNTFGQGSATMSSSSSGDESDDESVNKKVDSQESTDVVDSSLMGSDEQAGVDYSSVGIVKNIRDKFSQGDMPTFSVSKNPWQDMRENGDKIHTTERQILSPAPGKNVHQKFNRVK